MTSFPRQHARTRRFSLGVPRAFAAGVGVGGPVVLFLRTDTGSDALTHLWRHDPRDGSTRKLVDAAGLGDDGRLPPEERSHRERAREQAGGIVAYAVDTALSMAAFALGGRLYTVDVASGEVALQPTVGPAFDPRPSPNGRAVAYHAAEGLHLVELPDGPGSSGQGRELVSEVGVSWGRAEFVAAEEMGRSRGCWWSGDGSALAVARVDESAVPSWTIADPANPWTTPVSHAYPAAGTVNAEVSLWIVEVASGRRTQIAWDATDDEYLAHVGWGDDPLTLLVQPRDQQRARVLTADPRTGAISLVHEWSDEAWVELVAGSPAWFRGGLLTVEDRIASGPDGTRAICRDGVQVTPAGLQVREILAAVSSNVAMDDMNGVADVGESGFVEFLASPSDDPTRIDVHRLELGGPNDGSVSSSTDHLSAGLRRTVPALPPHEGTDRTISAPWVEVSSTPQAPAPRVVVRWAPPGASAAAERVERELEVVAETPLLRARPRMLELGARRLRAALLLPDGQRSRDEASLPVVLDPYGGPHAQRVVSAQAAYLTSQWLADQGYAVLVVDGRGSPGRGPAWEREIHRDLATVVLEDQIDALHAAALLEPRLDLSRVGIRGWSFGGYLAALAVLRRPDVFRAAIAGAPVTDWRLYDTHYTERYLGHPDRDPDAYDASSLIDAEGRLSGAMAWPEDSPPGLLLIHGLADDNVVAAHSLRLSSALLADGRPHTFLPLSGVTHMTPQEVVAEQLLTRQVGFLREHLGP